LKESVYAFDSLTAGHSLLKEVKHERQIQVERSQYQWVSVGGQYFGSASQSWLIFLILLVVFLGLSLPLKSIRL